MSRQQRHLAAEAVFFFREDDIVAAMKYDDFREYLLSGRPVGPFRGTTVRGVFASIGDGLAVRAACLFLIPFDAEGIAPHDWSLPVRELAHNSGDGPDLGHGTIRLATRGQCSIPWHTNRLWGGEVETDAALQRVQAAVRSNTLDLKIRPAAPRVPALLQANREAKRAVGGGGGRAMQTVARPAPPQAAPIDPVADPVPEAPPAARTTDRVRTPNQTMDLPATRIASAARRFDDTFGKELRVRPEHLGAKEKEADDGSALARLRARHAAELARLRSAHERESGAMQAEIDRLRRLLRAASEV